MPSKYEVSLTIGVREVGSYPNAFQASESLTMEVAGFSGLTNMLTAIHGVFDQLRAGAVPPQGGPTPPDDDKRGWRR